MNYYIVSDAHYVKNQDLVRPQFNHKALAKRMKSYHDGTADGIGCGRRNVIVDGISESQKFLEFVKENGNEKLFQILESMRNETEFLHDVGSEEKRRELNKHPGKCTYLHSPSLSICCLLQWFCTFD